MLAWDNQGSLSGAPTRSSCSGHARVWSQTGQPLEQLRVRTGSQPTAPRNSPWGFCLQMLNLISDTRLCLVKPLSLERWQQPVQPIIFQLFLNLNWFQLDKSVSEQREGCPGIYGNVGEWTRWEAVGLKDLTKKAFLFMGQRSAACFWRNSGVGFL